jgi:hypothetical protein
MALGARTLYLYSILHRHCIGLGRERRWAADQEPPKALRRDLVHINGTACVVVSGTHSLLPTQASSERLGPAQTSHAPNVRGRPG